MQRPLVLPPDDPGILGIPATHAQPALQTEFYKELIGKLAWAVGSSYGTPYSNNTCLARLIARDLARELVTEHGYSWSIILPGI